MFSKSALAVVALALSNNVNAQKYSNGSSDFDIDDLTLREVGARDTLDWRVWLEKDGNPISFWHDVPLYPNPNNHRIINFVVEIPRHTDAKIEIKRDEPLNPIFHDSRRGLPRYVESVWPHKSYPFLYGSIPQTWESPNLEHDFTGFEGDNDPIDLFDIGQDQGYVGQVKQVKILGGLAPNDGGETDWKILGIDVNDPIACLVNSVEDVEKYRPGLTQAYRDWFTYYKVARGDDVIPIIGETYQNASFVERVIEQSHGYWEELIRGTVKTGKINYNQTSFPQVEKSYVSTCKAAKQLGLPKQSKVETPLVNVTARAIYNSWYYLDSDFELITLPTNATVNGTC